MDFNEIVFWAIVMVGAVARWRGWGDWNEIRRVIRMIIGETERVERGRNVRNVDESKFVQILLELLLLLEISFFFALILDIHIRYDSNSFIIFFQIISSLPVCFDYSSIQKAMERYIYSGHRIVDCLRRIDCYSFRRRIDCY